jgi:pentatricopeptide repeat protein
MAGEAGDAEWVMWEMARAGRVVDDITRRALVEELSRAGKREDADRLAREMEQKGIVSARELQALLSSIRDDGDDNLDV